MNDALEHIINDSPWHQIRSGAVFGMTAIVLTLAFILGSTKDSHVDSSLDEDRTRNAGPVSSRAHQPPSAMLSMAGPRLEPEPLVVILVGSAEQREATLNGHSRTIQHLEGLPKMPRIEVLVAADEELARALYEIQTVAADGGVGVVIVDERDM
jgi:hypothetical protein